MAAVNWNNNLVSTIMLASFQCCIRSVDTWNQELKKLSIPLISGPNN